MVALVSSWTPAMISLMDSVEATERSASLRTSPATTANPRPASPARAASIAAFSARRLVWAAISLINSRISPICCARSPSDPAWLATPSIWLRRNDMASPVRSAALTAVCMVSARHPAKRPPHIPDEQHASDDGQGEDAGRQRDRPSVGEALPGKDARSGHRGDHRDPGGGGEVRCSPRRALLPPRGRAVTGRGGLGGAVRSRPAARWARQDAGELPAAGVHGAEDLPSVSGRVPRGTVSGPGHLDPGAPGAGRQLARAGLPVRANCHDERTVRPGSARSPAAAWRCCAPPRPAVPDAPLAEVESSTAKQQQASGPPPA